MTADRVNPSIRDTAASYFAGQYGQDMEALLLTGSMARDEATIVEKDGTWRVMGDAEFLLIFRHTTRALPDAAKLEVDCRKIEAALSRDGIVCLIGANRALPAYLSTMKPHIFGYELRQCGQVLLGAPEVLSRIPPFPAHAIPLEEGWQLLMNRLIELLKSAAGASSKCAEMSRDLQYRTTKLYLDMASSLLIFAGAFEAGYRVRANRLTRVVRTMDHPPFGMECFVGRVVEATAAKLSGDASPVPKDWSYLEEALSYAHRLWRWELSRMTGVSPDASDDVLLDTWTRRQPLTARLRGWASPLRWPGLRRELLRRPHWLLDTWRTSPRNAVYAAASELAFHVPRLTSGDSPVLTGEALKRMRRLPLRCGEIAGAGAFGMCAREIVRNYETLLIGTRA